MVVVGSSRGHWSILRRSFCAEAAVKVYTVTERRGEMSCGEYTRGGVARNVLVPRRYAQPEALVTRLSFGIATMHATLYQGRYSNLLLSRTSDVDVSPRFSLFVASLSNISLSNFHRFLSCIVISYLWLLSYVIDNLVKLISAYGIIRLDEKYFRKASAFDWTVFKEKILTCRKW